MGLWPHRRPSPAPLTTVAGESLGQRAVVPPVATSNRGDAGPALGGFGPDDEDGTRCVADDLGGDRTQMQAGKSAVPAEPDHHQIRILGGVKYCCCRRIIVHDLPGGCHPRVFGCL